MRPGASREAPVREWARGLADSIRPFSSGGYMLNFLGDEKEDTIKATFGPNFDRLRAVKKKYDPENFFRLNQNIKPEDPGAGVSEASRFASSTGGATMEKD